MSRIIATGAFGVNVLSAAQDDLAMTFASRAVDRFSSTGWSSCDGLPPRLDDITGWATCEVAQTIEAGDHLLLVGTVTRAASAHRPPLVYSHRTFGTHSQFAVRARPAIVDQIVACAG